MASRVRAITAALALAASGLFAGPVMAEATQQCVWSCLYGPGKGNPASPAYNRCVETNCVGGGQTSGSDAAPVNKDPKRAWISGRTSAGVGYAGVDGRRSNTGLYYFCGGGRSFLRVIGIDGGERGMIVEVDGQQFPLRFSANDRNQPESVQSPSSPVMQALQRGNRVKVLSYEIGAIVDATLKGSGRALAGVISRC